MIYQLGEKLRALRERSHYSQTEVANILGIRPHYISGYESGSVQPSTEILLKLAGLYRTSVDYVLGLDNKESVSTRDLSDESVDIIKNLNERITNYFYSNN